MFNTNNQTYPVEVNLREKRFSLFELNRNIEIGNRILLSPYYQRNGNRWDRTKKSELIESILIGIPIPPIYASQSNDGILEIVDGRQRLDCIHLFMNDRFNLTGLKQLKDLNGKKFSELSGFEKTLIEDCQFNFYIIIPPTPESIKYDIFDRVNRGGVHINKQEMRNALYQGKITEILAKMSENENFKKAVAINKDMINVMKDKSLILGFIVFYLWRMELTQTKTINKRDDFFANVMKEINADKIKFDFEKFMLNFDKAMKFAVKFNGDLFRFNPKEKDTQKRRRKINIPLFESLTFALIRAVELGKEFPTDEAIVEFKNKLDNPDKITFGIDSYENINFRFDLAERLVNGEL